MREHIEAQSMHFDMPRVWDACAFLGNGELGALLLHDADNTLRMRLGHTGVYDNRPTDYQTDRDSVNRKMFMTGRLPVGSFLIETSGDVLRASQELSLYDAAASGVLLTEKGSVQYRAIVAYTLDCGILEWTTEDEQVRICYESDFAESPRQSMMRIFDDHGRLYKDYDLPKPPHTEKQDGITLHVQPYFCGGGYVTAYAQTGNRLFWTVTASDESTEIAAKQAVGILNKAMADTDGVRKAHDDWWHKFYTRTFLQMNDKRYERYYYAQLYKIACATRPNGRVMDTLGPWLTVTSWPAAFWNLNTQLTYGSMYVPCLFDMADSLVHALRTQTDILIENIDEPYRADSAGIGSNTTRDLRACVAVPGRDKGYYVELGNLPWVLFCVWTQYKMTMDRSLLSEVVHPLLRRCVNYYNHFLYEENGVLHLMPTSSPEYGVVGPDCNYDLSLLRASCQILLECVRILEIKDEKQPLWEDILKRLTPYPEHETEGFQINATQRMAMSHRHYSHLLMIYPLHLMDENDPEQRARIIRSIEHWHSMPEKLEGYSQTGAASMYAMLGDGNRALYYLTGLWDKKFIRPNTMYKEGGGPVLETPLAAMTAMLEMLLQSHGGTIRIFPALPDTWTDIVFDGLAAEGAFRVGATLQNGRLTEVRIHSLAGEACTVAAPFSDAEHISCTCPYTYDGKVFRLTLQKGEIAVLKQEN